jgi:NADP-dependent 3-hydroxy acid dehydrogenase YdfG
MTSGKVVAITGASSGIGEAIAVRLAAEGAKVVLGARRVDRLEKLAARITGAGGEVAYRGVDVTDRADVAGLVDEAQRRFGRLDVLVGNAGIATVAPLDDLDVDAWIDMVDVNIKGFLYGVSAALPVFRAQNAGQFVTIVSTSGLKVVPGQAVYAGTKNAVRTIAEGLRQEAGANIRVTSISPGYVATEFAGASIGDKPDWALDPDAVARAVSFAIAEPAGVDLNEIVIRPTAQG